MKKKNPARRGGTSGLSGGAWSRHPSSSPRHIIPLSRYGGWARQALGQLTSYVTAHLAAQFCTHVFSALLFRRSADLCGGTVLGLLSTSVYC